MTTRTKLLLCGLLCFAVGWLAAQTMPLVHAQDAKGPKWLHGLDLRVRKGGETEFKDAKKVGIEVFRDENNGNLVYITETGAIAVTPGK